MYISEQLNCSLKCASSTLHNPKTLICTLIAIEQGVRPKTDSNSLKTGRNSLYLTQIVIKLAAIVIKLAEIV